MVSPRHLADLYRFPGFEPRAVIECDPAWPAGVVITLDRRPQKGSAANAGNWRTSSTTPAGVACGISPAATVPFCCTYRPCGWSATGAAA